MDVLQAWRMINDSTDRLSSITRDVADVHQHAATFINLMNDKLPGENIYLSPNLPEIRLNRQSKSPTAVESSTRRFEISCHNFILDTVIQSIKRRFSDHNDLYEEISLPKLSAIPEVLPEINTLSLREDLVSLPSNYAALKQGLLPQDPDDDSDEAEDENLGGEVNEHPPSKSKELVRKIARQNCGFSQQRTKTCTYTVVYKHLITLSITQCLRETILFKTQNTEDETKILLNAGQS